MQHGARVVASGTSDVEVIAGALEGLQLVAGRPGREQELSV
jgi:hypothetical protein